MLDIVITWVDGADASHVKKRKRWVQEFDKSKGRDDTLWNSISYVVMF